MSHFEVLRSSMSTTWTGMSVCKTYSEDLRSNAWAGRVATVGARRDGDVRSEERRRCLVVATRELRGGVRAVDKEVDVEGGERIGERKVVDGWGNERRVSWLRSWVWMEAGADMLGVEE